MSAFECDRLLADLRDLNPERVVDEGNGDSVEIEIEFRRYITVDPGDPVIKEKTYCICITTWDSNGDSNSTFKAETDDVGEAVDHVRQVLREEERRMAAEDRLWASAEGEGR